jgi:ribosome-associated translation inhibitor RaiA
MLIQIETDGNIESDDALTAQVEAVVNDTLDRFREKITRVSVHLSDQNSESKFGTADMRCQVEARLAGLQPISVSDEAETMEQAVVGAVRKLKRSLDSTLGRLDSRQ